MSHLVLSTGVPKFSKAVISLWFRVPKTSMDKAKAAYTGDAGKVLDGIVPLVIMGEKGAGILPSKSETQRVVSFITKGFIQLSGQTHSVVINILGPCPTHGPHSLMCEAINTYIGPTFGPVGPLYGYTNVSITSPTGAPRPAKNPTCIGVDCRGSQPYLYINFETNKKPVISSYSFNTSVAPGPAVPDTSPPTQVGIEGTSTYTGCSVPFGLVLPFFDVSIDDQTHPVYSPSGGYATGDPVKTYDDISMLNGDATASITSNRIKVTPDKWHHVLVSVDLKIIKTHGSKEDEPGAWHLANHVDNAAQLFVALDDINYTKSDLADYWSEADKRPNDVITEEAFDVALAQSPDAVPSYVASDLAIPSNDKPLGLPGTAEFVNSIYRVELAEFLMFVNYAGDTFDTGIERNRRLFITKKDTNGRQFPANPVPLMIPINKNAIGDPATWEPGADWPAFVPPLQDPSGVPSAAVLEPGERAIIADVDFTKCSFNWMMGRNLGKVKGKVVKTGKIKAYFPDPKLES